MMRRQTPRVSRITLRGQNVLMHSRNKMSMSEKMGGGTQNRKLKWSERVLSE